MVDGNPWQLAQFIGTTIERLVLDAELPAISVESQERCPYYHDGSCLECVKRCPAEALDATLSFDRQSCYQRLLGVAKMYEELGQADVCGKCAIGPCAFEAATAS
jgi:epoxyqueuosine reductase